MILTKRKVRSIPQRNLPHLLPMCGNAAGLLRGKHQQGYTIATAYVTLWTLVVRPRIVLWTLVASSTTYLTLVVSYGAYKTYVTLVVSYGAYKRS